MEPGSTQMMNQPMCDCPMGSMGPATMILSAVLVAAIIAVLIALTVFLIRRSRATPTVGK